MRRAPAVALALFIVVATAGGPAAAALPTEDTAPGAAATGPTPAVAGESSGAAATTQTTGIVRHELSRSGLGEIRVDLGIELTAETAEFRVTLPAETTVIDTDGFDRVETGTYEWDGRTESPGLTYRADVNRTVGDSVRFAATGEWALVDVTDLDTAFSWRSFGDTEYERRFTAPNGHVGASMAYLGDHRVANASGGGQQFVVVHPTAVSTNASAEAYATTLAEVAPAVRVGARDSVVTAFVAPPPVGVDGGEGGVGGLATRADLWVAAGETTRTDDNGTRVNEPIFVHEYVHTRQNYSLTAEMEWFTEASAFYYMALLPNRRGAIPRSAFDRRFRVPDGARDATLTGTTGAAYNTWATKGARTLAALDRRIRESTGGNRTLQDVFRRLNAQEGNVTYADFRAAVATTAGESHDDWLDRHVDGPELAAAPVPDAYPAPDATADPAGAEWQRGDEWVPLSRAPLPAGIPVQVRHPDIGVVVRPVDGTTGVNVSGGDPATIRLPAGEASLRVETFYGRNGSTVTVTTSDDVDGDGVTNAAELDQGSDPYDPASSTAATDSPQLDDGNDSDGESTSGAGAGFGGPTVLVALIIATVAILRQRR
jgi:hypothetical protein